MRDRGSGELVTREGDTEMGMVRKKSKRVHLMKWVRK